MTDLERLLEETSRTFALCIPLLPEPNRREVMVAYLLFRIADTFEDAAAWSQEERVRALEDFAALMDAPSAEEARRLARVWVEGSPSQHEGYLRLLESVPAVLEAFLEFRPEAQAAIRSHTLRTAEGMAGFVSRSNEAGELTLRDFDDLKEYCYVVAGIVGEMLTELYLLSEGPLRPIARYLRERARFFGEGLQLTNILKDANVDVGEGRSFLPSTVERPQVFACARQDLDIAAEYTLAIQRVGAPRGLIAFNALPALLARATLDAVEARGPGAKITRGEVMAIFTAMNRALDRQEAVIPFVRPETARGMEKR